jgi:glycosyltransferase involved in cell wall biosynthesis
MRILFLESFYGGSHKAIADAIVARSRHTVDLVTLPAHNWKWRIRSSALTLAERVPNPHSYDLIVSGGMKTVSDLRAHPSFHPIPLLLYAHETQLTYPTPDGKSDLHLLFTDIANISNATHTSFNSDVHRHRCLTEAHRLLGRMPRPKPQALIEQMHRKSSVCHPGIDDALFGPSAPVAGTVLPPLILWNHRWEFDKNPLSFFAALRTLKTRGVRFRLAVLGESFQTHPREFETARDDFTEELVAFGFVESREAYRSWLEKADVVVSTAVQENFGLSVVEAIAAGSIPVLPQRLSYPEIIPDELHGRVLYRSEDDLADRLEETVRAIADGASWIKRLRQDLQQSMRQFAWSVRIGAFDALFERIALSGVSGAAP